MKLFMFLILFSLLSIPASAQSSTVTWSTNGWVIKAYYTNPADVAGSTKTLTANISIEVDGVPQTITAATELFNLPVPVTPSTTSKIWTSTNILNTGFTISEVTGDGTAIFDATGKLVFRVNAKNDGLPHFVQFKLRSVLPSWVLQYVPGVKQYLAGRIKIIDG